MTSVQYADAFLAEGPDPAVADRLQLFGQFVGNWDLVVTTHRPVGSSETISAEWHFAWALGGRAQKRVRCSCKARILGGGRPLGSTNAPYVCRESVRRKTDSSFSGARFGDMIQRQAWSLMNEPINLAQKLALFEERFLPRIVATMNDYKIEVVKVEGEFVWHSHPET
jgi:hypothetical protein